MTKTEILEALKQMTADERLEIIESISRMMREDIEEKAKLKAERKLTLAAAARAALPDYMPENSLHDLWSSDSGDDYQFEEEIISDRADSRT